jgi:hypothetical protein
MRALGSHARSHGEQYCSPCVYFSTNLDPREYPVLDQQKPTCGLGFLPGDSGCTEMRTENCSVRKAED